LKNIAALFFVLFALTGCKEPIETEKEITTATQYAENFIVGIPPSAEPDIDAAIPPSAEPNVDAAAAQADKPGVNNKREIPTLASTADDTASFIPDNWSLTDSVQPDYNGDGLTDFIGVISRPFDEDGNWYPRILFAAFQTNGGKYALDFQDINLVRAASEGGVFGDPYLPMTCEGNTFTINAYGGSAWKWSESTTFEYRGGNWYFLREESRYGYGPTTTDITENDYHTGIGVTRLNNDDFENIGILENDTVERFELEYDVPLDPAPTLFQASRRWWLASERLTEIPVSEVIVSANIDLEESDVTIWSENTPASDIQYTDENYILYTFHKNENRYLAVYDCRNQTVNVISQAKDRMLPPAFEYVTVYRDKIYYSENISATVLIKGKDDEVREADEIVSAKVLRMNLDGSDAQTLFQYDNAYTQGEILETNLPYIVVIPYPSGGELVISLYIGNAPKKYYRLNLDGSNARLIGELKGFSSSE
jgi:hypothetical protein